MTAANSTAKPSGLVATGITKRFGGRAVLDDVSFAVAPGEIVGLVGENGAGKTTLLRVVCGFLQPEAGQVSMDGQRLSLHGPRAAAAAGIGMVHQHFLLVPELTVAENAVLGSEPGRGPLLDLREASRRVRECAEQFGLTVDPSARVGDLGVAERQQVELLKVLIRGARFLLLDEPTGLLPPAGVTRLFELVRRLADGGCGIVLVTHRLSEVVDLCVRATVLRHGRVQGAPELSETTEGELARLMIGEDLGGGDVAPRECGEPVLVVRGLTTSGAGRERAADIDLTLHAGEIVGLAGVSGSGQTALLEALVGARPATATTVDVDGADLQRVSIAGRRTKGLRYVPADRHDDGLVLPLTVAENLALSPSAPAEWSQGGLLRRAEIDSAAAVVVREHDVRPPSGDAVAGALSGGNQQKVLLARELQGDVRVLVTAEPTRGLDFRAVAAVHGRLRDVAAGGATVLVSGTDLPELLGLCDRIVVICAGRIAGIVRPGETDEEQLGLLMAGSSA